jgi:hypothetical protein
VEVEEEEEEEEEVWKEEVEDINSTPALLRVPMTE